MIHMYTEPFKTFSSAHLGDVFDTDKYAFHHLCPLHYHGIDLRNGGRKDQDHDQAHRQAGPIHLPSVFRIQ